MSGKKKQARAEANLAAFRLEYRRHARTALVLASVAVAALGLTVPLSVIADSSAAALARWALTIIGCLALAGGGAYGAMALELRRRFQMQFAVMLGYQVHNAGTLGSLQLKGTDLSAAKLGEHTDMTPRQGTDADLRRQEGGRGRG